MTRGESPRLPFVSSFRWTCTRRMNRPTTARNAENDSHRLRNVRSGALVAHSHRNHMNTDIPGRPQRRPFLLGSGAVAVAPLILNATASGADAADVAGVHAKLPAGYQSLGPEEAAIVEKIVDVMCPADALTAGGRARRG